MDAQSNDHLTQPQDPERRRKHRLAYSSGWIGGVILVVLGILLLLQNLTSLALNNWWALFILIPAAGALGRAWQTYQDADRRLTAAARSSLFGGVVLTLVAAMFLFDLSWTSLGPALLILAGVGLLIISLFPRQDSL